MSDGSSLPRPTLATAIAVALLVVDLAVVAVHPGTVVDELSPTLVATAVVAELLAARLTTARTISGAFIAGMLAVGFLGPAMAFVMPVSGYLAAWVVERYRWRALVIQHRRRRHHDGPRGGVVRTSRSPANPSRPRWCTGSGASRRRRRASMPSSGSSIRGSPSGSPPPRTPSGAASTTTNSRSTSFRPARAPRRT